jgi:glycosyltransferase involved in cell wall biosynthesis
VQTVIHLPFGPLSYRTSTRQAKQMGKVGRIIVISDFVRQYLKTYGKLDSTKIFLPVYGSGPFDNLGNFSEGYLTLVNPCLEKGIDIFLRLASDFPRVNFAVVPTWGADDGVIRSILAHKNVHILPPADNLDDVWKQTRVLLVPSIWFETFGYVVVEAMLRGIPVVASDIGGLPEAKLGVDYLVPINPAVRKDGKLANPGQDIEPWRQVLKGILTDEDAYENCSAQSRKAASSFLERIRTESFCSVLESMELART